MDDFFRVAVHYNNDCGYIEYNLTTHQIEVVLDDASKRSAVEAFLTREHVLKMAQDTLLDFKQVTGVPTENLKMLQVALGDLWINTKVHVDWSRPVVLP